VQTRFILAAALRIGGAQGRVKRAADFFVEECVACVSFDAVVATDRDFAKHAGAGILFEHPNQEVLTPLSRRFDNSAGAENEADSRNFPSAVNCGKVEADDATGCILYRPREDFAIREILPAGTIDPAPATDADVQVGAACRDKSQLVDAIEHLGKSGLGVGHFAPRACRIVTIEHSGGVDEIFVLGQRHFGFLCGGLARELCRDPAQRTLAGATHELFHQRPTGLASQCLPGRVNRRQGSRVFACENAD
jgi:hypothetical protein